MSGGTTFRIPFSVTASPDRPLTMQPLPPMKEPCLLFISQCALLESSMADSLPMRVTVYVTTKSGRFALATLGGAAGTSATLRLNIDASEVSSFSVECYGATGNPVKNPANVEVALLGEQWMVLSEEQVSALSN